MLDRKKTLSKQQLRKLRKKILRQDGELSAPNFRPVEPYTDPYYLCPDDDDDTSTTTTTTDEPGSGLCADQIEDGFKYDFVLLYDNSCGLKKKDCNNLLEGVGLIISELLEGAGKNVRVQTMEIRPKKSSRTLVSFDDRKLQKNPDEYAQYVLDNGKCTGGGGGKTNLGKGVIYSIQICSDIYTKRNDLYIALMSAKKAFNLHDDRLDKIIVVSACKDTKRTHKICTLIADTLDEEVIDVYAVNLIHASSASNVILHLFRQAI